MIIGGRAAVLGSRPAAIDKGIAEAQITIGGPAIRVNGSNIDIAASTAVMTATLRLLRYGPRTIAVAICAGQNGDRTIPHRNLIRELTPIDTWDRA